MELKELSKFLFINLTIYSSKMLFSTHGFVEGSHHSPASSVLQHCLWQCVAMPVGFSPHAQQWGQQVDDCSHSAYGWFYLTAPHHRFGVSIDSFLPEETV